LQTRNQSPGKVKIRIVLDDKSGLQTLIDSIHQQKNVIENITIRDLKKRKIEFNLKVIIRKKITLPELYGNLSAIDHVYAIALEH
ncbi:MAG: hypothetical protein RSC68_29600, partial [Acinetobacter sp.]